MEKRGSCEKDRQFSSLLLLGQHAYFYASFYIHQSNFRTKVISNEPKAQLKFGCLRWTSRLGTLCSLLLLDLKNPEIKNNPLILKPT